MTQFLDLPNDLLLYIAEIAQRQHHCTWWKLKLTCRAFLPIGRYCMPYCSLLCNYRDTTKECENWVIKLSSEDIVKHIKYIPVHRIRQFWCRGPTGGSVCWPEVKKVKLSYPLPNDLSDSFPGMEELEILPPLSLKYDKCQPSFNLPMTLRSLKIHVKIVKRVQKDVDFFPVNDISQFRLTTFVFCIVSDDFELVYTFFRRYHSYFLCITELRLVITRQHDDDIHDITLRNYLVELAAESTLLRKVQFHFLYDDDDDDDYTDSEKQPVFLENTSVQDQLEFYWQAYLTQYGNNRPDDSVDFRTSLVKLRGRYTVEPRFMRCILCQGPLMQLRTLKIEFIQHPMFLDPLMAEIMRTVFEMTQLRSLMLNGVPRMFDLPEPNCTNLQKLDIRNDINASIVNIGFFRKISHLTSLKYEVARPYEISWNIGYLCKLRKLDITNITLPDEIPLQLEELSWSHYRKPVSIKINWERIQHFLRTHPRLRKLKLQTTEFLPDSAITVLQECLPQLECLHLHNFQIFENQRATVLSLFPYCSITECKRLGILFNRGYNYQFHFMISPGQESDFWTTYCGKSEEG